MPNTKGSYRINKHKYWDDLPIKYNLQYNPLILGYGNPNYYSGDVKTWQNATDNLRFQFEMIDYLDNNGTDLKSLEIWNEPNLKNYWGSDSWVTYSQTANKFGYELKKRYPEKEIIGCSIASQNGEDYIDAFYRRGGLMYVDGFSCHPYIYPMSSRFCARPILYREDMRPVVGQRSAKPKWGIRQTRDRAVFRMKHRLFICQRYSFIMMSWTLI